MTMILEPDAVILLGYRAWLSLLGILCIVWFAGNSSGAWMMDGDDDDHDDDRDRYHDHDGNDEVNNNNIINQQQRDDYYQSMNQDNENANNATTTTTTAAHTSNSGNNALSILPLHVNANNNSSNNNNNNSFIHDDNQNQQPRPVDWNDDSPKSLGSARSRMSAVVLKVGSVLSAVFASPTMAKRYRGGAGGRRRRDRDRHNNINNKNRSSSSSASARPRPEERLHWRGMIMSGVSPAASSTTASTSYSWWPASAAVVKGVDIVPVQGVDVVRQQKQQQLPTVPVAATTIAQQQPTAALPQTSSSSSSSSSNNPDKALLQQQQQNSQPPTSSFEGEEFPVVCYWLLDMSGWILLGFATVWHAQSWRAVDPNHPLALLAVHGLFVVSMGLLYAWTNRRPRVLYALVFLVGWIWEGCWMSETMSGWGPTWAAPFGAACIAMVPLLCWYQSVLSRRVAQQSAQAQMTSEAQAAASGPCSLTSIVTVAITSCLTALGWLWFWIGMNAVQGYPNSWFWPVYLNTSRTLWTFVAASSVVVFTIFSIYAQNYQPLWDGQPRVYGIGGGGTSFDTSATFVSISPLETLHYFAPLTATVSWMWLGFMPLFAPSMGSNPYPPATYWLVFIVLSTLGVALRAVLHEKDCPFTPRARMCFRVYLLLLLITWLTLWWGFHLRAVTILSGFGCFWMMRAMFIMLLQQYDHQPIQYITAVATQQVEDMETGRRYRQQQQQQHGNHVTMDTTMMTAVRDHAGVASVSGSSLIPKPSISVSSSVVANQVLQQKSQLADHRAAATEFALGVFLIAWSICIL